MPNKFKSSDRQILHCPHCRGVVFKVVKVVVPQPANRMEFVCRHCEKEILLLVQDGEVLVRKGLVRKG